MKNAILCPGQGAQTVGMGKDFYQTYPEARQVYDDADKILGFSISQICFEGPDEKLQATDNAQVGIFVTTAAICQTLKSQGKFPESFDFAAGLSLGEYTALYLAGVLSFFDAVKLVRARGELMQAAALKEPSTMLALVGADEAAAEQICREASDAGVIVAANFNTPGQIVLSGAIAACQKAAQIATQRGLRSVPLNVAGAFHSPYMKSAAEQMEKVLSGVALAPPKMPVISNVTARPHENVESIRRLLVQQIIAPVRWQQSMEYLKEQNVESFLEPGPGRALTGMLKKIDRRAGVKNISEVAAVNA
ncbi:MAG TPA: ACP S-malonyltransferase [Phycisphaerae bacterium]|nr:ACP S-malonyltransferase [Phycisphaerae bacterium]